MSLADSLADGDAASGLSRYARAQHPFGAGIVRLGQREGAYLTAQLGPEAARSAAERRPWDIDDLMRSHRFEKRRRPPGALREQVDVALVGAAHAPRATACDTLVVTPLLVVLYYNIAL